MRRAFLICPVRGYTSDYWQEHVDRLEADGWTVHWPPRDTDQRDPVGMIICHENRAAIGCADRVFLIWDGKSTGCLFDLGMAWALHKPLTILSLPDDNGSGKSFLKMTRAWEKWGPA